MDILNKGIQSFQNLINPLPPKQTANDLKELRKAVGNIPPEFNASVEWIQNNDNTRNVEKMGGHYLIHPLRKNEGSTIPFQSPEVVVETKRVMHHEIRQKLVTELQKKADESSSVVNEFRTYSSKMQKSRSANPYAPVDRAFLENIFSDQAIHTFKEIPIIAKTENEERIGQIIDFINIVKREANELGAPPIEVIRGGEISSYLKNQFNKLVASRELSGETKKFIEEIRKENSNWIDESLENLTLLGKTDFLKLIPKKHGL